MHVVNYPCSLTDFILWEPRLSYIEVRSHHLFLSCSIKSINALNIVYIKVSQLSTSCHMRSLYEPPKSGYLKPYTGILNRSWKSNQSHWQHTTSIEIDSISKTSKALKTNFPEFGGPDYEKSFRRRYLLFFYYFHPTIPSIMSPKSYHTSNTQY